jgi:predicted DNA-binding transcriptional regulator YafY
VARYVQEATWHPSQRLAPVSDGSLLAEFSLSGTEEIKQWLLGFGRHAVVLEPVRLREEIIEELRALLEQYGPREPAEA